MMNFCKINGKLLPYRLAGTRKGTYRRYLKKLRPSAKKHWLGLRCLGKGIYWTIGGVRQNSNDQHWFWG